MSASGDSFLADYLEKVKGAYAFAQGSTGESWVGLFELGLALAGLTLIPCDTHITPESHWKIWINHVDPLQPTYWIAEGNCFS